MGWMNCFARWVTSPTFRTWWPIIEPMYSGEFGRFLRERYPVLTHETGKGVHWERKLTPLKTAPTDDSLAWKWWTDRSAANPAPDPNDRVFGFDLVRSNGSADVRLQVALAIVRVDGATASWTSDRFYVPPSLWGAGIGGGFMDELIKYLEEHGVRTCNVEVRMPRGSDDAGARADRVGFIEFYKRHRFRLMEELPKTETEGAGVRLQLLKRPLK